jgi:hypothetical protein
MNDQPTTSSNAFLLNDKPPSTHQLVVASVTNIDSQGSINNGPVYFAQLPFPNDSRAITTLSFLHLHVPFRTIGCYHPTKMLANNDLYPTLLHPILLTNRVYNDRQANMENVLTKCLFLLPISNGTAIMTATPSLLLPLCQDNSAIMMATHATLLLPFYQNNSVIMTATQANLFLPCCQDNSSIMMATHASYSLQLIVELFSMGAQQVVLATICINSFKLIDALTFEGAIYAPYIFKNAFTYAKN